MIIEKIYKYRDCKTVYYFQMVVYFFTIVYFLHFFCNPNKNIVRFGFAIVNSNNNDGREK